MDSSILFNEYVRDLNIFCSCSCRKKKLFRIGFIGLTGVGKSTVAQRISNELGLFIFSNDSIREFLWNKDYRDIDAMQPTVSEIAVMTSKYLLENKISYIHDADFFFFHEKASELSRLYHADFFTILVECSESEHLKRLKNRTEKMTGEAGTYRQSVGIETYRKRKELYQKNRMPPFDFRVDTTSDLDSQIKKITTSFF